MGSTLINFSIFILPWSFKELPHQLLLLKWWRYRVLLLLWREDRFYQWNKHNGRDKLLLSVLWSSWNGWRYDVKRGTLLMDAFLPPSPLFLQKKMIFLWAWPTRTPFVLKLSKKMVIFRGFSNFFSELLDTNYSC